MKAKLINEDINPLFKPKSKEEIEERWFELFKEKTGHSYEECQQLVNEFNKLGADAFISNSLNRSYISEYAIRFKTYQIISSNHVILECITQKTADLMLDAIIKYSTYEYNNIEIQKSNSTLGKSYYYEDAVKILEKIKKS